MRNLNTRQVHRIQENEGGHSQFEQYQTELLNPLQPDEPDIQFFTRLDAQLNKVNLFYKKKEAQYIARAKRLEQQLLTLFQVREEHERQRQRLGPKAKDQDKDDEEEDHDDEELVDSTESEGTKETDAGLAAIAGPNSQKSFDSSEMFRNAPYKPEHRRSGYFNQAVNCDWSPFRSVMNHTADFNSRSQPDVKLTIHKDEGEDEESAQRSKFSYLFKEPKTVIQDMIDLSLSKKKIATSEKMLRKAFVEFYRGLNLLKSYSSLNLVAFAKIMKKYDKAVKQRLGSVYLKEVERSYFITSNKISKIMVRVEDIFTQSFSSQDRQKAMAQLRPQRQHSEHTTTFFFGLFSGISMLLLAVFIVMLRASPRVGRLGDVRYMNTVFYVFSSLALVLLHLYLYGWNLYTWRQTRINYPFIFEFKPGTELGYRQVLCVASGFTSLLLAAMNSHLYISTKRAPRFKVSEIIPLAAVLIFVTAIFAPVNLLYRSARRFFIRCFQHLILAPFRRVVLADFFLGDQLTSQVFLFRNIQFMLCYYSSSSFLDRVNDRCDTKNPFSQLVYVFSMMPYWWRFLQCLRRYRDEEDTDQLWNAGKYASALIAVLVKTRYVQRGTAIWLVLFILFSCIAMLYQLYWDLVIDWGLLQPHSQNPWLRDQVILKKKYLYFLSMIVNAVLRVAWLSSIQGFHRAIPGIGKPGWDAMFAALEVIRRGHWNFYRLENEHLNNVGKYRAVKSVPLPFDESDGGTVL